jgi:hypothetical protein
MKPDNSNFPVPHEDVLKDEQYNKGGRIQKVWTDQLITPDNRPEWCIQQDGLPIKANSEWNKPETQPQHILKFKEGRKEDRNSYLPK